ncbi:MAG: aminoacyl-tRNA hydrolase [Patescibacteria group bacterium]
MHFLIVGLGNPGKNYEKTRHNAGFLVVDALARHLHAPEFKLKKQLHSLITQTQLPASSFQLPNSLILAKPQTYMNLSGKSIAAIISKFRYFDISTSLLVISDDLDLPLGIIRFRERGGAGGHQGLQSIINALGTEEFPRLKIGIRPPHLSRQPGKAEEFVLKRFSKEEFTLLHQQFIPKAVNIILKIIQNPNPKIQNEI